MQFLPPQCYNFERLGPLTMKSRAYELKKVLDIQQRAGVDLINTEEESRIHQLWAANTWPRKWKGDKITGDVMVDALTVTALGDVVRKQHFNFLDQVLKEIDKCETKDKN